MDIRFYVAAGIWAVRSWRGELESKREGGYTAMMVRAERVGYRCMMDGLFVDRVTANPRPDFIPSRVVVYASL